MRSRTQRAALATGLLAVLIGALGCAGILRPLVFIEGEIQPRAEHAGSGSFLAGAARVDITPIPGIPMNYSMNGKVSRGFWTRLYARAIYVEDSDGEALVFVSTDLPHIPNGLGDRVAQQVRERPVVELANGVEEAIHHLGREQILLAATHAHNGPENYFSDGFYNGFVSARAGFDPEIFDFLAARITDAIEQAYLRREVAQLKARSARLDRLFRNRSFGAFRNNADAQQFVAGNSNVAEDCERVEEQEDRDVCRAVRADVEVIDLVGSQGNSIAKAIFLAAHPTVLGAETQVFQGDALGVAATLLERQSLNGCTSNTPLAAFFNGAQGDASFTWKARDRYELLNQDPAAAAGRLGIAVQLARFACGAESGNAPKSFGGLPADPKIKFQFDWIDFSSSRHVADPEGVDPAFPCQPWNEQCTVAKPLPGVVAMGGAQDGRTFWYEFGVREGLRSAATAEHGRKPLGLEMNGTRLPVVKVVADSSSIPKRVPVGVYRVGGLVFAALPGEFTTMMGERIRRSVATNAQTSSDHVFLVGLANGHVSYVTTPEEYDAQYYEGASNVYGAATGPVIETKLLRMAANLDGPSTKLEARDYFYDPGFCRVFQPRDAGLPTHSPDDGLGNILLDLGQTDARKRALPERGVPSLCWVDAIPKLSHVGKAGGCARAVPYVWVEPATDPDEQCRKMWTEPLGQELRSAPCTARPAGACTGADPRHCENGVPVDNCGLELLTLLNGSYMDRTRWCAYWMPPKAIAPASYGDYALCVAGVTDEDVRMAGGIALPSGPLPGAKLDRWDELDDVTRAAIDQLECRGCDTRPVCEWPLP